MNKLSRAFGRWMAVPPDEEPEHHQAFQIRGEVIYFEPEEEDPTPLRDALQPLPTDREWLQGELGISAKLSEDIEEWDGEWKFTCSLIPHLSQAELLRRGNALDAEAAALVQRMRAEIRPGLEVVLRLPPWPE